MLVFRRIFWCHQQALCDRGLDLAKAGSNMAASFSSLRAHRAHDSAWCTRTSCYQAFAMAYEILDFSESGIRVVASSGDRKRTIDKVVFAIEHHATRASELMRECLISLALDQLTAALKLLPPTQRDWTVTG